MLQESEVVRNAGLNAKEDAVGAAPVMKLRTGAPPANCAAGDTGTVIATFNLPTDWLTGAAAGEKALIGTVEDMSADAAGLVGHWRLYAANGTTCHYQGTVSFKSTPWAPSTSYVLTQKVDRGGKIYACSQAGVSAASGGPAGTGTAIVDGTAKWDYHSELGDVGLDNPQIEFGQRVTIDSFRFLAGNA